MATAAQLKAIRRKYHLGEFRPKKAAKRKIKGRQTLTDASVVTRSTDQIYAGAGTARPLAQTPTKGGPMLQSIAALAREREQLKHEMHLDVLEGVQQ
jgi:hypothetical protein